MLKYITISLVRVYKVQTVDKQRFLLFLYNRFRTLKFEMADCTKEYQKRNSKKRSLIKGSAKSTLEKHFDMERKPSSQTIAKLANSLRMKKKTVHIWFCNRRQKEKNIKPLTASNTPVTSTSQIPAEIQDSVDSVTPNYMSAPVQSTGSCHH